MQTVHRDAVGLDELLEPQLDRVEVEFLGDFIELNLEGEARLRRAVATLRSAGRLIGKNSHALELISRHFVSHRLQRAGIIDRSQAVAAVAAAAAGLIVFIPKIFL